MFIFFLGFLLVVFVVGSIYKTQKSKIILTPDVYQVNLGK